jgi:hypothetical protein
MLRGARLAVEQNRGRAWGEESYGRFASRSRGFGGCRPRFGVGLVEAMNEATRDELSFHGNAHEQGNIFIYAPAQRVLMVVDVVFPGWVPWRRFALAQDIPGYFAQVEEIRMMDWDTFVGGHVARTGTHADVDVQAEFNRDVKQAAATALATTKFGEGLNPLDKNNPWAFYDHYIDRVAAQCVDTLTPKWSTRLGGFDVFVWDHCYSMEQTLRIE